MSFIMAGSAILSAGMGIGKLIKGNKQRKEAQLKEQEAQANLDRMKQEYAGMDISNPYLNMENVYEDMTVNQQEAQFAQQQQQQQQANILDSMRGAAGGSGIAALAQTMAQQEAFDWQKSAESIGKQEQDIQQKKLDEEKHIRDQEIQGEMDKRAAEEARLSTLMGWESADLERATAEKAAGKEMMMSGVGDVVGGITSAAGGIMGASKAGTQMGKGFWNPKGGEGTFKGALDPSQLAEVAKKKSHLFSDDELKELGLI